MNINNKRVFPLTLEEKIKIINLKEKYNLTCVQLGKRFGVSASRIGDIIRENKKEKGNS